MDPSSKAELNIAVGSKNPAKIRSVVNGISKAIEQRYEVKAFPFDVPSGGIYYYLSASEIHLI